MISIREAKPEDVEAICRVHRESVKRLGPKMYPPEVVAGWSVGMSPESQLSAMTTGADMFVAVVGGEIAGFGSVVTALSEIQAIYVHPDFIRRGIGQALLHKVEEAARRAGVSTLKLASSLIALDFYKRHGYSQGESFMHTLQRSGVKIQCVWMHKNIDSLK